MISHRITSSEFALSASKRFAASFIKRSSMNFFGSSWKRNAFLSGIVWHFKSANNSFIDGSTLVERISRFLFLVALSPVRDLLLCAKHLFVAARLRGCSHHAASATGSASAGAAIHLS